MLQDILISQKREWDQRLQEHYVERESFPAFDRADDLVRVIVGPRRAGKSFFALHSMGMERSCGYANFDDERLLSLTDYDDLLNAIDAVYNHPENIILDEIQNLDRWELFVNRLQRQGRRLLVTGSNSNLLSAELATHLTGRHVLIPLLPFSFAESLRISAATLTESEKKCRLESYTRDGGFPEPLIKPIERNDYLRTLVQSVLYKDIVKRHRIRAVLGIEDLARYLFSNVAKEYSYRSLTSITRCRSMNTVEKYIGYLEDAFLFFSLRRFSFKVREQAAHNKKIYCTDNGLAVAMGFRVSSDEGRLWENLVAIQLWKHQLRHRIDVYFWRNSQNEEVDFVIKEGNSILCLIQVCRSLESLKTMDRELRALLKAGKELSCQNLVMISEEKEETEKISWFGLEGQVRFVPLWKWLLQGGYA